MNELAGQPPPGVSVRPGRTTDLGFLEEMLFEAFSWNKGAEPPTFAAFRDHPEFTKLLAGWGRFGDRAVIAEGEQQPVGAAWFRLWTPELHSYGFVDEETPELVIAVASTHRGRAIGRSLLEGLISTARADGFPALSLSVSPANTARQLYESMGFLKVGESGTSWTLRLMLG